MGLEVFRGVAQSDLHYLGGQVLERGRKGPLAGACNVGFGNPQEDIGVISAKPMTLGFFGNFR